jgi:polygalacturonase
MYALLLCLAAADPWDQVPKIEAAIQAPTFPSRSYSIAKYGAVAGDPKTLNHEAINQAISECSSAGGGTVVVPKGVYYTGPLTLKNNVNLHLDPGSTLRFTTDVKYFYPAVLTRWEGNDCYNAAPLIYAYGCTNIAITGTGTIDGAASKDTWWGSKMGGGKGRNKLMNWQENGTPVDQRVLTADDGLRPQLINLYRCTTVEISGVTLTNSPFWVIHPLMCKSLTVKNVVVNSRGPNNDGCDPESSSGVLILNCTFDTGDDCIAIKSGRDADGRKWNMPSENIIVRGCTMKDGHGGVTVGSEISGGFKNLFVENCKMDSANLERVIRIKSNNCRGGTIDNINVRNVQVGQCKEAILDINLKYEPKEDCNRAYPPKVTRIHLEKVTSEKSKYGVLIVGLDNSPESVDQISLKDCTFKGVTHGNSVTNAKPVEFTNCSITK